MQLSDQQIRNFQELYQHETGIELSIPAATEKAYRLFNLIYSVYKPIHKPDLVSKNLSNA